MTEANGSRPPTAAELRGSLESLMAEGQRLHERASQAPPDLRELLGLPAARRVTITRDARGLIDGIAFEKPDGAEGDREALIQELNIALFTEAAGRPFAAITPGPQGPGSDGLPAPLRAYVAALESGQPPEPVLVTNDLKTVTVGALWGDIVSVSCSPSFLLAASDATLADEIVSVVRAAALQTDSFGKYSEGTPS